MSSTSTGGSERPSIRLRSRRRVSATALSGRGVALPASTTAPCWCARCSATVAGVVAGVPLVLVGRVVLLVDDDQADVGKRCEHRRARPDAHARLARAQPQPLVVPLALTEPGMEHRDHVAEPRLEPSDGLGRERDLGDEHDRAAAGRERRLRPPAGTPRSCPSRSRRGAGTAPPPPRPRRAAPAPASSAPRTASSAARCSPVSSGAGIEPPADRHRRRAPSPGA